MWKLSTTATVMHYLHQHIFKHSLQKFHSPNKISSRRTMKTNKIFTSFYCQYDYNMNYNLVISTEKSIFNTIKPQWYLMVNHNLIQLIEQSHKQTKLSDWIWKISILYFFSLYSLFALSCYLRLLESLVFNEVVE